MTVKDEHGNFVGRGFYDGDSQIAVRLVTWNPDEIVDRAWTRRRIAEAVALRTETLALPDRTDAWRVILAYFLPSILCCCLLLWLLMSFGLLGALAN